ncbi:MAG: hypothetical protein HY840_15550 [Bacteroidetes bacterium]|nr:hypothetical protein [Bacteroidota bacterium]
MNIRCLLFFILLFAPSFLFSKIGNIEYRVAQGAWTKKADFPGSSRNYGLGFSIGKKGYYGMGQKQAGLFVYKSYTDMWEYDSEKNIWTQKADFPGDGRLGTKGFLVNDKIYVGFGYVIAPYGPTAGSNVYQGDLYEFDPALNKWSKKNDRELDGGSIFFTIKDTVYALNVEFRILRKYNASTDTWTRNNWTKKDIAPKYRNIIGDAIIFSIKEKEYIITAVKKNGNRINQLWMFDPHTAKWSQKGDLPVAGSDTLNAFSVGEKGYVRRSGNEFLEYDPSLDVWTEKNEIPSERKYFSQAFVVGEKIYGFSQYEFWEFIP